MTREQAHPELQGIPKALGERIDTKALADGFPRPVKQFDLSNPTDKTRNSQSGRHSSQASDSYSNLRDYGV